MQVPLVEPRLLHASRRIGRQLLSRAPCGFGAMCYVVGCVTERSQRSFTLDTHLRFVATGVQSKQPVLIAEVRRLHKCSRLDREEPTAAPFSTLAAAMGYRLVLHVGLNAITAAAAARCASCRIPVRMPPCSVPSATTPNFQPTWIGGRAFHGTLDPGTSGMPARKHVNCLRTVSVARRRVDGSGWLSPLAIGAAVWNAPRRAGNRSVAPVDGTKILVPSC